MSGRIDRLASVAMLVCAVVFVAGCGSPIEADGPDDQRVFVKAIADGAEDFSTALDADNSVQSDAGTKKAESKRNSALCDMFGDDRNVSGWVGEVTAVLSGRGGGAGLEVQVGSAEGYPSLQSDDVIEEGTAAYKVVSGLSEGDMVKFSGEFYKADDSQDSCVRITNLTGTANMGSPDFAFTFKDVKKL